ncbi:uncharacterized protein SOCE26_069600 [Sorangium cellulosum]|uniref:Transposase n=1 Tax=Sorangium cellulosum TaxID=56 RepID=A0A2L0F1X8_SORCE|nr:Rpn family recombination-promoting nuclease/putative transposase [Sorangium cellulosum]AUX45469.1 uncharacterized protein SOCE26_069600 [Sorangium cellulosum]
MRPLFADPKTDFVFKKIFGSEEHKPLLIALLNDLLELDAAHRIATAELLSAEQRPKVAELKHSIVDVKCIDAQGTRYVVEMQVLNVEGFEKRVVYNVAKAYTGQLDAGQQYPELNDVIGVTICDFELWPGRDGTHVPMLSRWRMQEQHGGARGLGQLQFVFLELPKYDAGETPRTTIEKWAFFFREASNLRVVPEALAEEPFTGALEVARVARFTDEEWDAYIRAGIALQDERGALSLARSEGRSEGRREGQEEGLRAAVRRVLARRGLTLAAEAEAQLAACTDLGTLERWLDQALTAATAAEALR